MPLAEFLRMSKGKMDATPQRASFSTDTSCRADTDLLELVWESGQIVMQGQSNKSRNVNNLQIVAPKPEEGRNGNGSKMAKFSMVDSVSPDFRLTIPSCEMGLDHDVDMVPWLNYPIEDPLHNEHTSDFLHELSGVSINEPFTESHLATREKKSGLQGYSHSSAIDEAVNLKHVNTLKVPSSTEKHGRDGSDEVPQFSRPFQHNIPISSSISDITRNNNGSSQQMSSRDSIQNPSSLCVFTSLRLQKFDSGQPSTSTAFVNFPSISQHAACAKADRLIVKGTNRSENDDKRHTLSNNNPVDSTLVNPSIGCSQKEMICHNQSVLAPVNKISESLPAKPTEEVLPSNQAKCGEDIAKTDALQSPAHCARMTKAGMAAETNMEPVVATSSVCSGNSVGRASNVPVGDLKRKSHETGESDDPSEEVEEDSVGARRTTPARKGSKRTRAAEVHNLSERRRRDRINEKMRVLQELIPNCKKVDKASMLDEAIEYLKTLQLQVQMFSMGAGFYMQPMMLPPGMPPIQGAHMPHFSTMGVGMGMGMGLGFNMLNMNNGMKMIPFPSPHYPIPNMGPAFHGIPGSGLQAFGHPGQGLPMSVQRPPVLPASVVPSLNVPLGSNVPGIAGPTNATPLAPSSSSKDVGLQMLHSNSLQSSINQASIQSMKEGTGHPPPSHDQAQAANTSEATVPSSGTEALPS